MQTATVRIERDEMTGMGNISELVAKGKSNGGTLTCGELIEAFSIWNMTPDDMDGLYQRLSDESIEIVDDTAVGDSGDDESNDHHERNDSPLRAARLCAVAGMGSRTVRRG